MNSYRLAERAVLMQVSMGMPGKSRKDGALTDAVKSEHSMGQQSGAWIKQKYPQWALQPFEKICNEARTYHSAVTLPFNAGVGILPAPLIMEYGDKMREFKFRFEALIESHFKAKYGEMVAWAKKEHNGSFDPSDYPGLSGFESDGSPVLDVDGLKELCQSFYFRTEPLPVPDAGHFEGTIKSLLGVDADTVDIRIKDAMQEAQRELMQRLIAPVKAMVAKLNEPVKEGKKSPVFRDSLVGNLKEIAELGPKLNIAGDPKIDSFVQEIKALTVATPDDLRESEVMRKDAATKAADILTRLQGYSL